MTVESPAPGVAVRHIAASKGAAPREGDLPPVKPFDVEQIRVSAERRLAEHLEKIPEFAEARDRVAPPPPDTLRRMLMAEALRLSETMAPDTYAFAHAARRTLRIDRPLEIYQSSGRENAAIHLIEDPIVLQIMGRLMTLLDRGAALAVFGHEFGHYLAHGPWTPIGRTGTLAARLLRADDVPARLAQVASALAMAKELTADRLGLLACQDLAAQLRLEMICTTSLPGDALHWDTEAYLLQCRELIEALLKGGESAVGVTHPEHSVRAWAAWLFSETREYRALTGQGPGTRALADVDALIDKVLALPSLDGGWHMFDAPPPEVHECALACCVLVASADGELSDAEADVLERAFARHVSDWRWYLDVDHAVARLEEVAPVMRAAGPAATRPLFTLLLHVIAADGKVFDSELEMLRRVGDFLGASELFDRLTRAALRAAGLSRVEDESPTPSIPLPPRRGEAAEGLRALLAGVVRRRGGQVSLRRLLRLVGATEANPEVLAKLAAELRYAGVEVAPGLAEGDLDTERTLTVHPAATPSAAPVRAARRDASLLPEERARLLRAVTALRDELVSGDGRSPAVRLHAPRPGRVIDLHELESLSTGLAERTLAQLREGRRARLVDAAEAGTHAGGRRVAASLLLLDRESRAREEETGRRDLAVGHPFLVGVVQGYLVRGPLVLYPAAIERDARGARGFTLVPSKDEPPTLNLALLRLLFLKRGFAFTDALAESLDAAAADPARSTESILATLAQVGLDVGRSAQPLSALRDRREEVAAWSGTRVELEECAALGFFSQSNSDLLQDYDALLTALGSPAADLGALLGCAATLLPAEMRAALLPDARPSSLPPSPEVPLGTVLYADPSQRAVLARAATERALVIDGPPGTGKSQVIVNLIADALARGERVAVVCEKRAALDVVAQRAQAVGLRHALALVHDVSKDRKALYAQLAQRLEESAPRACDVAAAEGLVEERGRIERSLRARAEALAVRDAGGGLSAGQLHALAAGIEVADVPVHAPLAAVPEAALEPLADALLALRPFADLFAPGGRWSMERPSYADLDAAAVTALRDRLSAALSAAQRFDELAARCPAAPAAVRGARAEIEEALSLQPAAAAVPAGVLAAVVYGVSADPSAAARAAEVMASWRAHGAVLARFSGRVEIALTPEAQQALAVLQGWVGRFGRFFVGAWWRARRLVRASLLRAWPERSGSGFDRGFLDELRARVDASNAWTSLDRALDALGLSHARPADVGGATAALGVLEATLPVAQRVAALRPALQAIGAWLEPGASVSQWSEALAARRALVDATHARDEAIGALGARFPWLHGTPAAGVIASTLQAWVQDGARLAAGDRALAAARARCADPLPLLASLARALGAAEPNRWRDAVVRAWARARIAQIERAAPGLAQRDAPTSWGSVDAAGAALAALHERAMGMEAQRVLARLDDVAVLRAAPAQKGRRRTADQAAREAMLKECRKQRSVMPLRAFARRFAGAGLLEMMPVWLLSPETISVIFPQEPLFDLVIFDEASQCTVESGLPVLLRARRALVVGDERQMPPSSFFSASATGDQGDDAPESRAARELLDAESLLALARTRLDRVGLEWHYRCRHEELIAFSNHALYEGQLRTVPSSATGATTAAIRWVAVPDGSYESGRNVVEAQRVVDVVSEVLARPEFTSVGVVTFNLPQRAAVLDAIDARRAADDDFARRWDAAATRERVDERPFVKNLESVQGDERDVIVFSTGHAPVERKVANRAPERYVPARFGPLGQRGGERRLNVAISRARLECAVVASFEPEMLSVARSTYDGPRLFKAFLEYAWHVSNGRRPQAAAVLSRVRGGDIARRADVAAPTVRSWLPLRVQVASALQAMGLQTELDVGTSTARIPLAVVDPKDPARYRVAVLCDEGAEVEDVFERWVHRPRVLEMRGWRVLSVDARRWDLRRQDVLAEVLAALDRG